MSCETQSLVYSKDVASVCGLSIYMNFVIGSDQVNFDDTFRAGAVPGKIRSVSYSAGNHQLMDEDSSRRTVILSQITSGEILSHPENSVPQTLVLRYQEIGGILCTKQRSNSIVSI
jgi:hypothetical protein